MRVGMGRRWWRGRRITRDHLSQVVFLYPNSQALANFKTESSIIASAVVLFYALFRRHIAVTVLSWPHGSYFSVLFSVNFSPCVAVPLPCVRWENIGRRSYTRHMFCLWLGRWVVSAGAPGWKVCKRRLDIKWGEKSVEFRQRAFKVVSQPKRKKENRIKQFKNGYLIRFSVNGL